MQSKVNSFQIAVVKTRRLQSSTMQTASLNMANRTQFTTKPATSLMVMGPVPTLRQAFKKKSIGLLARLKP
jgi:hypothetical protein